MQRKSLPQTASVVLSAVYAVGALLLLGSAPNANDPWLAGVCVAGGLLLAVSSLVTFTYRSKEAAPSHIMSGPEVVAQQQEQTSGAPISEVKPVETKPAEELALLEAPKTKTPPTLNAPKDRPGLVSKTLRLMMIRSQDVVATLRDLIVHNSESALGVALAATGINEMTDAPTFECGHLRRSQRFWFQTGLGDVDDDTFDTLISAEAVLNVYQDALLISQTANDKPERMRDVIKNFAQETISLAADIEVSPQRDEDSEWDVRMRFAEFCEKVHLPFRMSYDFDVNLKGGAFDVSVAVPRPRCFAFLGYDEEQTAEVAVRYAIDVAEVLADGAFAASKRIDKVQVRCHEFNSQEILLSFLVDREDLNGARVVRAYANIFDEPIGPGVLVCVVDPDTPGAWFTPLEDNGNRIAELLERPDRWVPVELLKGEAPRDVALSCGAVSFSDLGTSEGAGRVAAWMDLAKELDGTMSTAINRLVALRDKTDDYTVTEAANRVADALVNDKLDVTDTEAMAELFIRGSSLDRACAKARKALDDEDDFQAEVAVARLEAELAPLMETGLYLDDELSVYRYFNSIADRLTYNLEMDDGTREVRLVPDAYYAAHSLALRLHTYLGHPALAMAHADELIRMAPATADPYLAKVRLLEDESSILDAVDVLKEAIINAPIHHDMAIAFYRLAFMEWKLGRADLSVACYERSIELYPPAARQALIELNDLLEAEPQLKRHKASELEAILTAENIPYGDDKTLLNRYLKASKAVTDAELFSIAWQMLGAYVDADRDDVIVSVYRSLRPRS